MAFNINKPQETDTIKGSADNIRNNFIALLEDKFTIGNGAPSSATAIDYYLYFDTTNMIFYQYKTGAWNKIAKLAIDSLVDVEITSISDKNILVWNNTLGKWVNSTISSTVDVDSLIALLKTKMKLSDLVNVSINTSTLTNGDILQYNIAADKWMNIPISSLDTKNTTGAVKTTNKIYPTGVLADKVNTDYAITYVNENFYIDENGLPKLGTQTAGNGTKPIYMSAGKITECTFTVASGLNIPSDAKFTDTTYAAGDGLDLSGTTFSNTGIKTLTFNSEGTATVNGTNSNVYAVYAS